DPTLRNHPSNDPGRNESMEWFLCLLFPEEYSFHFLGCKISEILLYVWLTRYRALWPTTDPRSLKDPGSSYRVLSRDLHRPAIQKSIKELSALHLDFYLSKFLHFS